MSIDLREPFTSQSIEDTAEYAKAVFDTVHSDLNHATIFTLSGDLGAGKTTFAKCFAQCFFVEEGRVTSPTFVIQKSYPVSQKGFTQFVHIDAYRIENPNELLTIGWDETIRDPKNIILLEWPENTGGLIPDYAHSIVITYAGEDGRTFTYKPQ